MERVKLLGLGPYPSLSVSPDGRTMATGSADTSILLWDLAELATRDRKRIADGGAEDLTALFTDLGSSDGTRAYSAVWKLVAARREAVAFLNTRVKPTALADERQVASWIVDLDSAIFADRDKATRELERQGELAKPLLRKALSREPTLEVRRRAEDLLRKIEGPVTSTETLRSIRAVEVLEHIATPEARHLLQKLAEGALDARLTREAKAALARLEKRQ
jgi:hypothetical protein